jgi:hypothetical protein
MKSKNQGWKGEKERHSLAKHGVCTECGILFKNKKQHDSLGGTVEYTGTFDNLYAHHVKYRFWNDIPFELTDDLRERLESEAEERAKDMIKEGYSSGELNYEDDKIQLRGWWEIY